MINWGRSRSAISEGFAGDVVGMLAEMHKKIDMITERG